MGTADTFGKAYQKAQMCVGKSIPLDGTAIVDMPVAGFEDFFDVKTLDDFEDTEAIKEALHAGEIDLVLSREREILEVCVEETITYFSTIESAQAALEAIRHSDEPLDVESVDKRPKMQEYWGQPKDRENLRTQIQTLRSIADSGHLEALGAEDDDLTEFAGALDTVLETIDNSVLVLESSAGGSDASETIREELDIHGYNAQLADDLPGVEGYTGEEDIATYMMLSKFSVLIDEEPTRRLSEYETAKAQNTVLARLIPADRKGQQTHVIGGHENDDAEHIRDFEYETDPTEVLDEAISWAESVVERRRGIDLD
jgi:carbamoyl-phosphate synthase large subunit